MLFGLVWQRPCALAGSGVSCAALAGHCVSSGCGPSRPATDDLVRGRLHAVLQQRAELASQMHRAERRLSTSRLCSLVWGRVTTVVWAAIDKYARCHAALASCPRPSVSGGGPGSVLAVVIPAVHNLTRTDILGTANVARTGVAWICQAVIAGAVGLQDFKRRFSSSLRSVSSAGRRKGGRRAVVVATGVHECTCRV